MNPQPSGKRRKVYRPPPKPAAAPAANPLTPALARGVLKAWNLEPAGQQQPPEQPKPPRIVVTPPDPEKRNISNLRFACQEFVRFGRRLADHPAEAAEILGTSWRRHGRFLKQIRAGLEEILRRMEE